MLKRAGCLLAMCGALALTSACAPTGPLTRAARQTAAGPDFSGVWWVEHPPQGLQPLDGGAIPFTPRGRAAYERYRADLKSGKSEDLTRKYCLPDGLPRLLSAPYPFEVVLTQNQATFLHEARHVYRAIPLTAAHPPDARMLDAYMGNPIARWEGDTLVIDSVRFNDETRLDASGLPHSEQLHETERWRKIDAGARLEDLITIEDPLTYTRAWSTRITFRYRPDVRIEEYVCGEPHRPIPTDAGVR